MIRACLRSLCLSIGEQELLVSLNLRSPRAEGLCPRLLENLSGKLQDVRYRLYDNGLPAMAEQMGKKQLRWATLFLKCYKQANSLLEQVGT
jgi:hypothetical protein